MEQEDLERRIVALEEEVKSLHEYLDTVCNHLILHLKDHNEKLKEERDDILAKFS